MSRAAIARVNINIDTARCNQMKIRDSGHKGNKSFLPTKVCLSCQRPFSWRKKWARCWDEVSYCSERCAQQAKQARRQVSCDN